MEEGTEHLEHEYQEIGEMVKNNCDDNIENIRDKNENNSDCENKEKIGCELGKLSRKIQFQNLVVPKRNVTLCNTDTPKAFIEYGMITAKEVAKYRPCTQDVIVRDQILS